ncbi:MAG: NAD(P)-dependent alcohol dehydrogenase [Bacteroidota bacterium]
MKAITYAEYGSPEVLQLQDLPSPQPKAKEVLIRVKATSVNIVDCIFRAGYPYVSRLGAGLFRPSHPILGTDLSGVVEAVGEGVKKFKIGDEVFASTSPNTGAHAEYFSISEDGPIALKPVNMSFEDAAAVPYGALTALPFLRDTGKIKAADKVLINGAAGGVGMYAVQLAKYFGAEVTTTSSARNFELLQKLGADHLIDYHTEDFTQSKKQYDIIFDAVGKSSFGQAKHVLSPNGIYMTTVPTFGIMFQMLIASHFRKQKAKIAFTGLLDHASKEKDLIFLKELIESGKLIAIVDKAYPFEEVAEAHSYVEGGQKSGNVVLWL